MAAKCGYVKDKSMGRAKGTEEETVTVGHHRGRDFRNTKKKGWEGRRYGEL